jgi:hypothetical protein
VYQDSEESGGGSQRLEGVIIVQRTLSLTTQTYSLRQYGFHHGRRLE